MLLFKLFGIIISATYFCLFVYFIYGWFKRKEFFPSEKTFSTFVSIIIPARNEEKNIEHILHDISVQNFPKNLFEVIVVDDYSEDTTKFKVQSLNIQNLKLIENTFQGKKNAIKTGIQQAKGELIIASDADCRMGKSWLSTMVSFYENENPEMIIAPVCFHNEKNIFEKIQSLEFLSLSGITASSALAGNPLMCNGANIAYRKKAFFELDGFEGNEKTPSGDDVLLMQKFKKNFSGKILYLKSREAIVYSEPQKNFSGFINQRKRWLSKNKHYNDFSVIFTSWFIFIFNFSILSFAALSFLNKHFAEILFISLGTKIFVDFLFLLLTASFFRRKSLLWFYIPAQIIYVFYVPLIVLAGIRKNFIWKGRKYNLRTHVTQQQ